jgi:hypothetical protein
VTEFPRLLESSSQSETRELLRAALVDKPGGRSAERALIALGLTAVAPATAAAASGAGLVSPASAAPLGWIALAKSFGVGLVAGSLAAGSAATVRHLTARADHARGTPGATTTAPAVSKMVGVRQPARASDTTAGILRSKSTAPHESTSALNPAALPSAFASVRPAPSIVSLPREAGGLAREVARIDRARAELGEHNPARALAELESYDRERETGTLDREAWLLRIEAFLLLGDRARAVDLAQRYLARFPKDAHHNRLRAVVEGR